MSPRANSYETLASFLQRLPQHIVWREESRTSKDGVTKLTKVPYAVDPKVKFIHAGDGYSIAPRCWGAAALAANVAKIGNYDGIGVVLGPIPDSDESIGGFDFDNCFEANGSLRPWAIPIFGVLQATYIERSPSLTGMKAFFRFKTAEIDAIRKALGIAAGGASRKATFVKKTDTDKAQQIELYLASRYFTETGLHFAESASDVEVLDIETLARLGALLPPKADEKPKTHDAPASLEDLASAVAAIPTDIQIDELTPRDVWLRIMMGLHHETGGSDEGFAIISDWSSQSSKFEPVGLRKQWNGLAHDRENPITTGTIFYLAEQCGWKREYRVPENAGTFAGMTLAEVVADLCFVTNGDLWWSLSRAQSFTEKGLNTALSGITRPKIEHQEYQPQAFVGWLRATRNVTTYSRFVRRGGQPPICESSTGAGDKVVNQWRALPPVPEEILERVRQEGPAALELWMTIVSDVCNGNPDQIELLLDWAAHVVMEPAIKPGWSVVLYSSEQGIGKDMFAYGLSRAVGHGNDTTIGRKTLERDFNTHCAKRVIHVSDLQTTTRGSMNGSDVYNSLKQVASNFPKTISINQKFMPVYDVDNLCAWIISTNDEAPMAIPAEDRRWFVVEGRDTRREAAFYAEVGAWLGGPEAGNRIRGYLQLRWENISKERRAAIQGVAPETEAKRQMVDSGLSPVMVAIKEMITGDDCPDLVTVKDIINQLHVLKMNDGLPRAAPSPNPTQLGVWMKSKFGATQVPIGKDGKPMPARLPDKKNTRVYAVRRAEMYKGLTVGKVGDLYASQRARVRGWVKY